MNTTITFDTLQLVQRLTKAGIKEPEAVAIAEAVRDVHANAQTELKEKVTELEEKVTESNNRLATKQDLTIMETTLRKDLSATEAALKRDLSIIEAKLEAKIAETKTELVKWVVSVGGLQIAIIAALIMRLAPS